MLQYLSIKRVQPPCCVTLPGTPVGRDVGIVEGVLVGRGDDGIGASVSPKNLKGPTRSKSCAARLLVALF